MTSPLYTKLVAVQMIPDSREQFKKLARSQGLSSSSLLRQMVAKELRRAAKEAAQQTASGKTGWSRG